MEGEREVKRGGEKRVMQEERREAETARRRETGRGEGVKRRRKKGGDCDSTCRRSQIEEGDEARVCKEG